MSQGSNTTGAFGYPLHPEQVGETFQGRAIELEGIPSIPRELEEFWRRHGHDLDPPPQIRRLIRESIEAACHVIQHRHLLKLRARQGSGVYDTAPHTGAPHAGESQGDEGL
jgi:hypothetical protein